MASRSASTAGAVLDFEVEVSRMKHLEMVLLRVMRGQRGTEYGYTWMRNLRVKKCSGNSPYH
jgi:hypothetical protein